MRTGALTSLGTPMAMHSRPSSRGVQLHSGVSSARSCAVRVPASGAVVGPAASGRAPAFPRAVFFRIPFLGGAEAAGGGVGGGVDGETISSMSFFAGAAKAAWRRGCEGGKSAAGTETVRGWSAPLDGMFGVPSVRESRSELSASMRCSASSSRRVQRDGVAWSGMEQSTHTDRQSRTKAARQIGVWVDARTTLTCA